MSRRSRRRLRIVFASLLAISVVAVGYGFAQSSSETTFESHLTGDGDVDRDARIAPEAEGITVVATDSNSWRGERSEGPRALAELVAFDSDGRVLYYNDSHTRYWDVDPVEGTQTTVEYSYADHLEPEACPTTWNPREYGVDQETWDTYYDVHSQTGACTFNGVERVNLSTGDVEQVWGHATPGKEATRYHDVDRLNETHLVVADIYFDGVFVVNTETDEVEWRWNASESFPTDETGDEFPKDWSHINDVEVLDDGRIMVSPRNMDRVIFVVPQSKTVDTEWTLGEEDDYDVLYEQHNPDFINESNGGPAVIVADSENNRVLEYQRTDGGEWEQTWIWRDGRMQWPRDADRLPNGHTLIADSNGNRVFEVDENGTVVWDLNIAFPYEAERLETGDESTNGPSAQSGNVASRTGTVGDRFWISVKNFLPGRYLNGLMYITPVWMGLPELIAILLGVLTLVTWGGVEARWRLR
ncbi:Arylsulfotransferase (ASST) [Halogranum rubrum]|uniref:Arylsulfotransferase (ASST) n=1 Tax=Halogranum rubrum TaxID=553466 RepID=A0A1I4F6A7_9EURY|nr:arylsulfotransferase family protein [Halogranum rubrum]SFL11931.1 Arylsulfotransferase (ASST) [Halogranum rubrum]